MSVTVSVEIDDRELAALIKKAVRRLSPAGLAEVNRNIAESLVFEVDKQFEDQQDPYGGKWKDLDPKTIKRRRKGKGVSRATVRKARAVKERKIAILQDSGLMRQSFVYHIRTWALQLGFPDITAQRAKNHDLGITLPKRQILPSPGRLPGNWRKSILDGLDEHLGDLA